MAMFALQHVAPAWHCSPQLLHLEAVCLSFAIGIGSTPQLAPASSASLVDGVFCIVSHYAHVIAARNDTCALDRLARRMSRRSGLQASSWFPQEDILRVMKGLQGRDQPPTLAVMVLKPLGSLLADLDELLDAQHTLRVLAVATSALGIRSLLAVAITLKFSNLQCR